MLFVTWLKPFPVTLPFGDVISRFNPFPESMFEFLISIKVSEPLLNVVDGSSKLTPISASNIVSILVIVYEVD